MRNPSKVCAVSPVRRCANIAPASLLPWRRAARISPALQTCACCPCCPPAERAERDEFVDCSRTNDHAHEPDKSLLILANTLLDSAPIMSLNFLQLLWSMRRSELTLGPGNGHG